MVNFGKNLDSFLIRNTLDFDFNSGNGIYRYFGLVKTLSL